MGLFQKKKKTDNTGLEVLTEIKEPFSFATFFENHVVERYRKIRKFLEEKGVLFFLLSPFQKRNRLIVQLLVIVLGVLLGVVPRSSHLVDQSKARNAASELAALTEKNTEVVVGGIAIRPLASSQYKEQHLMAFLLSGTGDKAIPSTPSRYDVSISAARGVSYPEAVTYSYDVLPVSASQRLLLVYADNRKQEDSTGIYNLRVQVKGEKLPETSRIPMEVVLSDSQKTTKLFNAEGIHLSSLTELVVNNPNAPIKDARTKLGEALDAYTLELERIAQLPVQGLEPSPTVEELETFVTEHTQYPTITDKSTTEDIASMRELTEDELGISLTLPAGLTYNGTRYDETYVNNLNTTSRTPETDADTGEAVATDKSLTDEETQVLLELESLSTAVDKVLTATTTLNQANQTKFGVLKNYKLMLNRDVDVKNFTSGGTVADAGN